MRVSWLGSVVWFPASFPAPEAVSVCIGGEGDMRRGVIRVVVGA